MDIFWAIYLYIIGTVFGSFYNVAGLRIPKKQSIIKPRSHCTNCGQTLIAIDLIPVFSYLFLRGKCRKCGAKISPIYLFTEVSTGILFAISYYFFGWSAELLVALVFFSLLMIIFVSDVSYLLIPDKILLFFFPVLFILRMFFAPLDPWWDSLLGAVFGFVLLLVIAIASRGGMGGGDIKLYAVIGLVLGFANVLLSFMLACFFGTIIAGAGLLIGKVKRGKPIAFGPYIVMGTIISYFFGDQIIHWYLQFI